MSIVQTIKRWFGIESPYLGRFKHGSSAYQKGCRCRVCMSYYDRQRQAAKERRALMVKPTSTKTATKKRRKRRKPIVHGARGYWRGCRCQECILGMRQRNREYTLKRAGKPPLYAYGRGSYARED